MHSCLDPFCYQCEIKKLKQTIQEQRQTIEYLREQKVESYLTKLDLGLFTTLGGRRMTVPITQKIYLQSVYFITITFDPARFYDLGTSNADEENYILNRVGLAKDQRLFKWTYGSFELTSAGITHAHMMTYTNKPVELTRFLKEQFTYNMRNQHCIKTLPAESSLQEYVNKLQADKGCENKTWFQLRANEIEYIKDHMTTNYKEREDYKLKVKEIRTAKDKKMEKIKEGKLKTKKNTLEIFICPNKN